MINIPKIPGLAEANIQVIIAYSLLMIFGLLVYIAFFKENAEGKKAKSKS